MSFDNRADGPGQSEIAGESFGVEATDQAYDAMVALHMAAAVQPELNNNPYFTALLDTAFARFLLNFENL